MAGEHRHCVCNGLWLCRDCHAWAHAHPYAAIDEGTIVPRYSVHPGGWSVQHYQGRRVWLHCDGTLSTVETKEEQMYLTDEEMDDQGRRIEETDCDHDYDLGAGEGQVHRNGAFEILDVCTKCGDERHTGQWSSVL